MENEKPKNSIRVLRSLSSFDQISSPKYLTEYFPKPLKGRLMHTVYQSPYMAYITDACKEAVYTAICKI